MADARVVSNHLVDLAAQDGGNVLTPMQVLKLVYIAHGYRLGAFRVPLIPNRIEAWKFGPVIPDLYRSVKHWRDQAVGHVPVDGLEPFQGDEADFVSQIYSAYRDLDGIALSNLTHKPNTPWDTVFTANRSNIPIPNDLIEFHYRGMMAV